MEQMLIAESKLVFFKIALVRHTAAQAIQFHENMHNNGIKYNCNLRIIKLY